jgi:hypothetical protein
LGQGTCPHGPVNYISCILHGHRKEILNKYRITRNNLKLKGDFVEFINNIITSTLANFIFWFLLGFIFWVYIIFVEVKLIRFFGMRKKKILRVYTSNLWKQATEKSKAYVASGHELNVATSVNNLFGSVPYRLPELVRGLIDGFWISQKIDVEVKISPINCDNMFFTNMILIGGTPKNSIRRYYYRKSMISLSLVGESGEDIQGSTVKILSPRIKILKGMRKDEEVTYPYNLALIEKVFDREHNVKVFMCTGLRADSSWLAVEFLIENWKELYKKYKEDEFALCIGFPETEEYLENYIEPVILERYPE